MRCVLCVDCDCQKTLLTRVQRMYGLTALACLFSFDMPVYYTLHGDTGPKAYRVKRVVKYGVWRGGGARCENAEA